MLFVDVAPVDGAVELLVALHEQEHGELRDPRGNAEDLVARNVLVDVVEQPEGEVVDVASGRQLLAPWRLVVKLQGIPLVSVTSCPNAEAVLADGRLP